ncbi:unnamed protein product [Spirodela intermedia]|uniref:PB1 domain-containing protein n=1 Tax=Spirodela intermedia TaxID=51605 RepID=A0A7I8JTA2_SPIIN|nr:unnamed protein product [Spirodela intermedia]CAA6673334.1 unnamed protein product [Spirodela intermedia]
MGKPVGKNKKKSGGAKVDGVGTKHGRPGEPQVGSPRNFDADMTIFIDMARELREEGNKLFQKRDYKGAILTYEKAVKLLPQAHADMAPLRSNLAACYMQLEPPDHHRAIEQCNLALEVSPRYSKALLKRARCYEAVDRVDFAMRDVDAVLSSEPSNATALELSERLRKGMEIRGIKLDPHSSSKPRKKRSHRAEEVKVDAEKGAVKEEDKEEGRKVGPSSKVKLVLGEDIRFAMLPAECSILQLREIVRNRFPSTEGVLVKYRDQEGDLVTITTTEELRWAEESGDPQGSLRLYLAEVSPDQDPLFLPLSEITRKNSYLNLGSMQNGVYENGSIRSSGERETSCIEEWIVHFAQLFKNHVGFNSDAYLDLHELGMKLYSEAMEDVVTSEDAQEILGLAEKTFQEMAALALFNWGNVHMSRARKRLHLAEDHSSGESLLGQSKDAYEWARAESYQAQSGLHEGFLALAQQQFEQAKLSWYYAVGSNVDLESWPSSEVMDLFNSAEDNIEKGTQLWEEAEENRLEGLAKPSDEKLLLQKMGMSGLFKEISTDEAAEQASNLRSQISLLWGTMLYERSVVEFKLKIPDWEECLAASIEKFKLVGASPTDLAVMIKNHCSNETAQEGLGFRIDEIVQAWNEMYDAKRWAIGAPSFRLEPLFRRRVPKLHHALEHASA